MRSNENMTSLDNSSLNDSFKFKIISGDVTNHHPCYAEELFSKGLIRRSFSDDYFSSVAALKQPVSLDHACVCPLPPVLPPPPPPPLLVNGRHHRAVCCCRKSLLGHFCRSVRKCLVMPFYCGISVADDTDTRSESMSSTDDKSETVSPARSEDKWIEFDNPIYVAGLHCKRSSLLEAINNRGAGSCMPVEIERASIDR